MLILIKYIHQNNEIIVGLVIALSGTLATSKMNN